ncbi:MAG: hypothetical protein PWP39_676 [Pyrococcus sp.]|nr:hypothetical protein [Pyrococcus sp.]
MAKVYLVDYYATYDLFIGVSMENHIKILKDMKWGVRNGSCYAR